MSDVDQLVRAIREVAAGGSVIDPKVVEALVTPRSRPSATRPCSSSPPARREVLAEMAQGRNNASIAAALGLSERAVEKHINSVFSKLGLSRSPTSTAGSRRSCSTWAGGPVRAPPPGGWCPHPAWRRRAVRSWDM